MGRSSQRREMQDRGNFQSGEPEPSKLLMCRHTPQCRWGTGVRYCLLQHHVIHPAPPTCMHGSMLIYSLGQSSEPCVHLLFEGAERKLCSAPCWLWYLGDLPPCRAQHCRPPVPRSSPFLKTTGAHGQPATGHRLRACPSVAPSRNAMKDGL